MGITMGTCKAKEIQADLGIFTHILAYSVIFRHIQTYSGIIRHIQELFRHIQDLVQTWHIQKQRHIQNPGILSTRGIFKTLVYAEHWHIQNSGIFRILGY